MDFLTKTTIDRNKQSVCPTRQKRRRYRWRKLMCIILCAVMLSTSMVGASTGKVYAETSRAEIPIIEKESGQSSESAISDGEDLEQTTKATEEASEQTTKATEETLEQTTKATEEASEQTTKATEEASEQTTKATEETLEQTTKATEETLEQTTKASEKTEITETGDLSTSSSTDPTKEVSPTKKSASSAGEGDNLTKSAKTLGVHITDWTWVDEEEFLTEYEGEWYLSLPGATAEDLTEDILKEMLPKELRVVLSDGETKQLPITWDFSSLAEASQAYYRLDAGIGEDYVLNEDVEAPYVLLDYGGAEVYDGTYPGTRRKLTADDNLADHTVQGITPADTTVNLFDYDPQISSENGDVLPDGAKFENYSNGINKNALLLFGGAAMREAGFWNLGSGAGRPWGKANTNMKGIVKSTLEDDYPYINLDGVRDPLPNATETPADGPWGSGIFMDIANLNHAEYEDAGVKNARALSVKLLTDRGLTVENDKVVGGSCEKTSLRYLFDPKVNTEGKESHQNVKNLFQIDNDGYYYYDARKNFAEYNQDENSFTLYDGPAVWRTDTAWNAETNSFEGDLSLGNFFPFDNASKVFDSIQTEDKNGNQTNILSSSEEIKNEGNAVKANHYMGMTMTVEFEQPENGKVNISTSDDPHGKQPMVFQFSGDDDVWIFIDDVLVLDLGGIHSELYGTIDFSTGEVVIGQSWRYGGLPDSPGNMKGDEKTTLYEMFEKALGQEKADAMNWATDDSGKKIFPTGTTHTLKLFYLERGNYDSSLQMRFNLQPKLSHSIKKVDQNGDALEGVEFKLYAAEKTDGGSGESADVADYKIKDDPDNPGNPDSPLGTLTTGTDGTAKFTREDGSSFSFADQYNLDRTLYYILKETQTVGGYRALPKDIVLRFNRDTSMLVVANRYQTGAYASFLSNIRETGKLTYGQFDTGTGNIEPSENGQLSLNSKAKGLIVAVPMLLESGMSHDNVPGDGKWVALYGSNTEGYGAVAPTERTAEAWRKAVLKAVLYQCSDQRWPEWRLTYDPNIGKLKGLLEDLPGRADRYLLNNPKGDMKMVYGIIEPSALKKLGIEGDTSEALYDVLEQYVSNAVEEGAVAGKSTEKVIDDIIENFNITGNDFNSRDFSFLNTDQFQRDFRSIIYIPNERRELRVQKVDEDGKGIGGVEFTLTAQDGSTVSGTTDQDGMLIFRPDAKKTDGYAQVAWAEVGSRYTLTETSTPNGYIRNETEIPVVVGTYSIYADAGKPDDGVTVMAGVGKLMQTMTKYAADDMVNITLRDITATAQKQKSGAFELNGWEDDCLKNTNGIQVPRSMNLHYGINAVVDYGLHDEDGGKNMRPFFTTDEGFLRTRVQQNTAALNSNQYNHNNSANWDDLQGRDLTSLFSLLNTVVVTNKKEGESETGKLEIRKRIAGDRVVKNDYTKNFTFTVSLSNSDDTPLNGKFYYYGEQRAGYIENGGKISLRHDEALTILGLPSGTKWTISEISENPESGWSVSPENGVISGTIESNATADATFTNYKGTLPEIEILKVAAEDKRMRLKGAEFVLYYQVTNDSETTNYYYQNGNWVRLTENITEDSVKLTSKEDGKISFKNIADGVYYLKELKAPDGYKLLDKEITITVKSGVIDSVSGDNDITNETGKLTLTVPNSAGVKLPDTGGEGTDWYTYSGLLLIVVALMCGYIMRRKNERRGKA